jgi:hypothetical protein
LGQCFRFVSFLTFLLAGWLGGRNGGWKKGDGGLNDVGREGEVLFVVCEIRNLGCRRGMVAGLSSYCFALLFSF